MHASALSGAAAAAAAIARMHREEEDMTKYGDTDLNEGWEFKILRSNTAAFKDPEKLRIFLEEEAQAGWLLVEKFDNARVRLKRPQSANARDHTLDFDPYRSYVGMSQGAIVAIVLACIFVPLAILGLIAAAS